MHANDNSIQVWGFKVDHFPLKCKKLTFKVQEEKRLMGLKVHHDGWKLANSTDWQSLVALVKSKVMSTCWLNWKKDLRFPNITFSSDDENLFLMRLYRGHFNTKCASHSTALQGQKWHNLFCPKIGTLNYYCPILSIHLNAQGSNSNQRCTI